MFTFIYFFFTFFYCIFQCFVRDKVREEFCIKEILAANTLYFFILYICIKHLKGRNINFALNTET